MDFADDEMTTAAGLDDAIVGVGVRCGRPPLVVYNVERVIDILMGRDGMTYQDAVEYFEYNVEGAWVGETTPIWLYELKPDDLQVH